MVTLVYTIMTISRSKRTEFIGAHIKPETKTELYKRARKKKTSASAIVAEAVEKQLEQPEAEAPVTEVDAK